MLLGIIINPKSGKKAMRAQRVYLWKLLRNRHQPFTYRVTRYANHALELARELVEKGYDQILVLGGDGTLSEVINGIMRANITPQQRSKIQFGLMPRGTGNDFARFWGLNKHFKRSLQLFFEGKSQPIDVGDLTYWRNGVEHHRYFINSVGFGIDSLTNVYGQQLKYYMGSHHINYAIGLVWALIKLKLQKMHLLVDGKDFIQGKMFHLNIANGPYNGGGMKQNADADPRDGILHGMFVEKPTLKQICLGVSKLFNGELYKLPFVHPFAGKDFVIQTNEHTQFEADGITMDIMGDFEVHCHHHALCMTVPQYCEEGKEIHDFKAK
ncbi:MAG: YegS/Rv2252/BmrU family lipid kinase [Paludibacteraceae bacterium]|nr:YegS/Rv2252/BmrU family lipid kinase [Paludibacteraceae bacterium]